MAVTASDNDKHQIGKCGGSGITGRQYWKESHRESRENFRLIEIFTKKEKNRDLEICHGCNNFVLGEDMKCV